MSCTELTTNLNARGVSLLATNDRQQEFPLGTGNLANNQALSHFRSALSNLSNACAPFNTTTKMDGPRRRVIGIALGKTIPIVLEQTTPTSAVYGRAFVMACHEPEESYELYSAQSAVLLYNFALGLHKKGLSTSDAVILKKAAFLYSHSLEVLAIVEDYFDAYDVVRIESLQNLARVYSRIGDDEGLASVLETLSLNHVLVAIDPATHDLVFQHQRPASAA